MNKITVFSYFHSNNIGDLLIADAVSDIFSYDCECSYATITGFNVIDLVEWKAALNDGNRHTPSKSNPLKKAILSVEIFRSITSSYKAARSNLPKKALEASADSELAVFAGGNSLMALDCSHAALTTFLKVVKTLKKNGKKVAFCFCGVGPFKTKAAFKTFSRILPLLDFISVRDNASYDLVKKAYPAIEAEIWRDPVLLKEIPANNASPSSIGVNVYFGYGKKKAKQMKSAFVSLIRELRQKCPDRKIYLFSSELTDIGDILSVKNELCDDEMVEVVKIQTAEELFALYGKLCCVLGTRMHTVITATVSHLPVVSISWQEKVTSLMDYFEASDRNFKMDDFICAPSRVCHTLLSSFEQADAIIKQNEYILLQTRENLASNINNFKKRLITKNIKN